jgi:GNAT superfamily N-acetyltransferase
VSSIRPWLVSDTETLDGLLRNCLDELRPMRGGAALIDTWMKDGDQAAPFSSLCRLIEPLNPSFFVASDDGGVLGWSGAWVQGQNGWIALYVAPGSRRSGLGSALLSESLGALQSLGIRQVDAYTTPGDRALKNLFEQRGFKARLLTMTVSL